MNKGYSFLAVAALTILTVVLAGCSGNGTGQVLNDGKETVKIGIVIALSGDNAFLGENAMKAVQLAESQIPEGTKYNYEFIFEDDRVDPKLTASATQKLINIDKVDAIISASSGTGNVVTPMAEQAGVIHFGIASDANVAKGDYNFIHWTTPEAENKAFVQALEDRDITRFAYIGMNQQGAMAVWDDLQERLEGTGIEITEEQIFNLGEKDFKTMLLKIEESDPEAILVFTFSPELELIAKQAEELNIDIPLTAIESFEYAEQPELFEGLWYIQAAEPQQQYSKDFEAMHGEAPKVASGNTYDIVNLLVRAYEHVGESPYEKPDNLDVAKALLTVHDYEGALGTLNVDSGGIVDSPAVVKVLKDGEPVVIG